MQKDRFPGSRALVPFHDFALSEKLREGLSDRTRIESEACQ